MGTRVRVTFLAGGLSLLGALACSPAAQPAPAPAGPAVAPAAGAAPQYGGVLKYGAVGKPDSLHPYLATSVDSELTVIELYDKLLRYDYSAEDFRADFPLVATLAERWNQPDQTTYVLTLRGGVRWHDGQPFTAEDVVWSLEYLRDSKNNFRDAALLRGVDKIEQLDALTVRISLKDPNPQFLNAIADPQADIAPKHVFDKGGSDALATAGIGTGPFKLKTFDPTGTTSFVRFEDYWRKDKSGNRLPFLNGIELTHNLDHAAQQAALAAREIDLYVAADKAPLDALTARVKDLQIKRHYSHHSPSLIFNFNVKPYDDVRVRRAFHLAIDRQELIDTSLGGEGIVAHPTAPAIKTGWGLPHDEILKLPGFRPQKEQDLAEAKRLLAEAGHGSGFKSNLVYNRSYAEVGILPIVAAQVKKIGVELDLQGVDSATYLRDQREGKFEAIYFNTAHPNLLLRLDQLFTTKSPQNSFGMKDAQVDQWAEELRRAFDVEQQKRITRQIQARFLEQAYTAPLIDVAAFPTAQPWVNNWYNSFNIATRVEGSAPFLWFDLSRLPPGRR